LLLNTTLIDQRMAKKHKTARVVPGARRLINSLRDLGYETPEAVADLIDNSIAAGAHKVDITVHFDGADSWIRISDDGRGMDGRTITEAMRYGTEREYDDDDLGKFGLGLKTASMSQCRRLTVASRTSKTTARCEVRELDLDFIERTNSWDILILGVDDRPPHAVQPLMHHRGTVALWEDLDRILTYQDPSGGWAKRYLLELTERIEQHVAMVFHRFLAGEVRGKKLSITINGVKIDPWDPFARGESATESLREQDFELNTPTGSGIVHLAAFILPPKASFSNEAEWRRMSGPNNWNRQQGFYVYRANRLIQSGGWSHMRTADEHTKLSRVGLMFSPALDSAFEINVAKMRVTLPPELRMLIEDTVNKAVRRARAVYDAKPDQPSGRGSQRGRSAALSPAGGVGDVSDTSGRVAATGGSGGGPREAGTSAADTLTFPRTRREALEQAASAAGEAAALERIITTLETQSPKVARDLGW
jgi:Histidine kinase-, DNA gyrase B-, and HSP90-like ATPase